MRRFVCVGLVSCGCGALVNGCATNTSSLFIRQVQALSAGACTYTSDPSATAWGIGVMDLMFAREYHAGLLVGNQLVARGDSDKLRAESSRVVLKEAEVHVRKTSGDEIGSFTVPGTGFCDPASGTTPGWGTFLAVLVDSANAARLQSMIGATGESRSAAIGRIVVGVKVFGTTSGGTDVESSEFEFPIEICYGCLVSFPADANDPLVQPQPNCQNAAAAVAATPCNIGQDELVDCRICKSYLGSAGASLCEP